MTTGVWDVECLNEGGGWEEKLKYLSPTNTANNNNITLVLAPNSFRYQMCA